MLINSYVIVKIDKKTIMTIMISKMTTHHNLLFLVLQATKIISIYVCSFKRIRN